MAWTLGQYQKAWNLIPQLSADDVKKALKRAGRTLPAEREQKLHGGLAVALHNYIAEKLLAASTADVKRSATVRRLDRIAKQAERLQKLMPDDSVAVTIATSQELRRALMQTPWLRKMLVIPSDDPAGIAALLAMSKAIAALAEAARRAYERERVLIEREGKRKGKARHKGDSAMRTLIGTINSIWAEAFDEVPGVTLNAAREEGGGSYLPFVHTLLHAYAARVPDELHRLAHLRPRLRLTQLAIYGHFRATGVSKLARMA